MAPQDPPKIRVVVRKRPINKKVGLMPVEGRWLHSAGGARHAPQSCSRQQQLLGTLPVLVVVHAARLLPPLQPCSFDGLNGGCKLQIIMSATTTEALPIEGEPQ